MKKQIAFCEFSQLKTNYTEIIENFNQSI